MDVAMTSMTPLPPPTRQQAAVPPARTPDSQDLRTNAVYVLYTSIDETFAALRIAGSFADALNVPLILVHYRTVPYPLAVDHPSGVSPIESEEFLERLRVERMDVMSRVYLCRDDRHAMGAALSMPSLVVVGGRRRWWPTKVQRWRRALEKAGHYVVFVEEHSNA
jgi:pimeloyl-ACP methyl ester carboxylesterase